MPETFPSASLAPSTGPLPVVTPAPPSAWGSTKSAGTMERVSKSTDPAPHIARDRPTENWTSISRVLQAAMIPRPILLRKKTSPDIPTSPRAWAALSLHRDSGELATVSSIVFTSPSTKSNGAAPSVSDRRPAITSWWFWSANRDTFPTAKRAATVVSISRRTFRTSGSFRKKEHIGSATLTACPSTGCFPVSGEPGGGDGDPALRHIFALQNSTSVA
mmetsp:Transcript_35565/g.100144  ORF Transcript_35565/g.100144 Transcript_35565/m.100144 type:complete len:218 (-) Transcript_35565:140-793(-)